MKFGTTIRLTKNIQKSTRTCKLERFFITLTINKRADFKSKSHHLRPHVFGAASYRSKVENPETQYCYLNSSTLDKLFNTVVSKRTDDIYQIEFIIEKQVGETDKGQVFELQTKCDGKSYETVSESEHQQEVEELIEFRWIKKVLITKSTRTYNTRIYCGWE